MLGKKGVTKLSERLHGREAIHFLPLGSIPLLFRKMPEPALTLRNTPPPPPPTHTHTHIPVSNGVLLSGRIEDRTREMAEWEKLFNNEKISKGFYVVSVQLVAVLSDSSVRV